MLQALADQLYLSLVTRWMVQNEAILTSIVYDHALRVRVLHKPEEIDAKDDSLTASPSIDSVTSLAILGSGESTAQPVAAAIPPEGASEQTDQSHLQDASTSTTATAVSTSSASTLTSSNAGSIKGKGRKDDKKTDKKDDKSRDLVGRLNNLVTSDFDNINGAHQIMVPLIEVPLMTVLSSWFLYTILGNSAWVGLAVMVVLLPVPAWCGKLINGVRTGW
jgi:hypothetical protein